MKEGMKMTKTKRILYYHARLMGISLIHSKQSNVSYPIHNHTSVYIIGLIVSGSIILKKRNSCHSYQGGQSFLIWPYEPHSLVATDEYDMVSLCISNSFIQCHSFKEASRIIIKYMKMLSNGEAPIVIDNGLVLNALQLIYSQRNIKLLEALPFTSARLDFEQLSQKESDIKQVVQDLHLSQYHFIRKFKKVVGLAPHQFDIQNRIRQAQFLLADRLSITEVALSTGFYDHSHFIRHFKKIVRMTPSMYRNACIAL